jgi:hypothetical protein
MSIPVRLLYILGGDVDPLPVLKIIEQRKIFTEFRISAHRLRIELGRYQGTLRQDRMCLHCSSGEVEDEIHYLLNCPNFIQLQNMEKIIWMINSGDHEILIKICFFIAKYENPE